MKNPDLELIFDSERDDGAKGELAIGPDSRLYWNGKPIITERGISLTTMQKWGAGITVTAAALGGFLALLEIIWWFKTW